LLLFGKKSFEAPPGNMARRLRALVAACPRPGLAAAREWLVFAGQIEQAERDAGGTLAVQAITDQAAALFLAVRDRKRAGPARDNLLSGLGGIADRLGAKAVSVRIPEGFAWYGLMPERYARTAEDWAEELPGRLVSVIGLRSIGTSLSAVVAEALRRRGARVAGRTTLRPEGHPYRREVELPDGLAAAEAVIIVDEGPGLSGSSMASVAEAVRQAGVAEGSIFLFPGHGNGPGPKASSAQMRWWRAAHTRLAAPEPSERPDDEGVTHLFGGIAAADGHLETLGRIRHGRQAMLAGLGFALPSSGLRNGWIAIPRAGKPLGREDLTASLMRMRLAPYIAAAARPATDERQREAALERIAEALIAYAEDTGLGLTADRIHRITARVQRLPLPPLRHGDGRLQPAAWVRLADGRILKEDATGTDCDHSWTGPQSVLWDVAGAAIEWNMTDEALACFLTELDTRFAIHAEPLALAFHRAGYCCMALAVARHERDGVRAAGFDARLKATLRHLDALC
jgi:hypothetical protein